eukprot:5565548-Prymnesium_polylepis.1
MKTFQPASWAPFHAAELRSAPLRSAGAVSKNERTSASGKWPSQRDVWRPSPIVCVASQETRRSTCAPARA